MNHTTYSKYSKPYRSVKIDCMTPGCARATDPYTTSADSWARYTSDPSYRPEYTCFSCRGHDFVLHRILDNNVRNQSTTPC